MSHNILGKNNSNVRLEEFYTYKVLDKHSFIKPYTCKKCNK